MADDKSEIGADDRRTVAGDEGYELRYFAEKHGIMPEQARELIEKHGNNRVTLDREAEKLKGGG